MHRKTKGKYREKHRNKFRTKKGKKYIMMREEYRKKFNRNSCK